MNSLNNLQVKKYKQSLKTYYCHEQPYPIYYIQFAFTHRLFGYFRLLGDLGGFCVKISSRTLIGISHSLGVAWAYSLPISYWVHFHIILKEILFYFQKSMLHNPHDEHSLICCILIPWLIESMYLKMIFFMRFLFLH